MKNKKKIISAAFAVAIISCSALTGFAAETENTESSSGRNFTVIEKTTIPNNTARIYTSGENIDKTSGIAFCDAANPNREVARCNFDFMGGHKDLNLPDPNGYEYVGYIQFLESAGNGQKTNFNTTGGEYERIRIKLSDYSDYFNSDGTHTDSISGGKFHNYNFTCQTISDTEYYFSSLIFMSGGAITGVAPTKDGYADIYVSTKLGQKTKYMTTFGYSTPDVFGAGGGTAGGVSFNDFMIGNIDDDGHISTSDAVAILKYSLNIATGFDELSKRNADADLDGRITVTDAIAVLRCSMGDNK